MKLSERVRYVGVNDFRMKLFESHWPVPEGISYNSYLVIDEKIALLDTVDAAFADEFIRNVKNELGDRKIDYLVINHMEPDHSALVSFIRNEYPECTVVANSKAAQMLEGYQGLTDNVHVVKEGETLQLGETSLQFFMIPMVHWPETMATWCSEEHTLFPGDAFGSYKAVPPCISDCKSNLFDEYKEEMIRYYASIVGKYGQPVQAALKKLGNLDIHRICSVHGPVWEKEIPEVVKLYDNLSQYKAGCGVCLAYGSMYGNTEKAAKAIASELEKRNIPYGIHNLTAEDYSYALRDVFKYDTLIVGSPTYNMEIFPPVRQFMEGVADRGVKNRKFAAFGSFTWAAASVKLLNDMAADAGFELLSEGISFKQGYAPEKFDAASLAEAVISAGK
ncbi:MAG: FprA family A-type flavoprotein [Bacteroidales bacterium]|jgi:flavorubredoxin|nr:FprA family A-type flavoprotein [Bacteroidales bacterium]MCI2133097.1 FprA family A-type flavoprotein [Bacteroidales bacterium]